MSAAGNNCPKYSFCNVDSQLLINMLSGKHDINIILQAVDTQIKGLLSSGNTICIILLNYLAVNVVMFTV